jgi:ectoine hydroxylase-related dioxygenase (phytanoyl-CoA dioxygenase family)
VVLRGIVIDSILETLRQNGFAVVRDALRSTEVAQLALATDRLPAVTAGEVRGGYRDIFTLLPEVRSLAAHPGVRRWPTAVLGPQCFAVRAILFDKTPESNWKVAWHQDLTVPVRGRRDVPGFGPWSEKAGILHVQPPVRVLERMLTVRVHLDACTEDNGPLRCLPGSHRHGKLDVSTIEEWKESTAPEETTVPVGGLLVMHPLVLHASSPAQRPGHRRVIHLEYAADELPGQLAWRERWGGPADSAE